MSVIVKTDRTKWTATVKTASDLAAAALAEQMLNDSEPFVPLSGGSSQSSGNLRESGRIDKGESGVRYLIWDTVYALYQWFGVRHDGTHRVHHYTTPGTGTKWVDRAKQQYAADWQKVAQSHFNGGFR